MPVSLTIRRADSDDVPEILRLIEEGLGASATGGRTAAAWSWKHERQPFGPSIVFVAESADSGLVGLRAFMRWRFRETGRGTSAPWSAVRAVDTVTHPGHRRRGIFAALNETALAAARDEGVDFVFNTPNAQSGAGYIKQGWREVGTLPVHLRPLRPLDMIGAGYRRVRRLDGRAARQWRPAGMETVSDHDVELLAAAPRRPAQGDRRRLESSVSPSFYRWRYCQHPHLRYYTIPVGEAAGPLVVRPNLRFGAKELVLCTTPGTATAGTATPTFAGRLRASGASYCVAHSHRRHPNREWLRGAGFHRVPLAGPRLLMRPLSDRARRQPPDRPTDWAFDTGDLELF